MWLWKALASDLGGGALEAILGEGDDIGGRDTVEDVEVQNVGFISAGRGDGACKGQGRRRAAPF